jgi:hypothetical protein
MKSLALVAVSSLSGCLLLPGAPGLGSSGQSLQSCEPVQEDPGVKHLEGQWQDWESTNLVYTFKDGKVTVVHLDDQLKPVRDASGAYTATDSSISVSWDDGKSESASFAIDNGPGCEMMNLTNDKLHDTRLPSTRFEGLERVDCHFDGDLADTGTTTAIAR